MKLTFQKSPPPQVFWGAHDLKATAHSPRIKLLIAVTDKGTLCRIDFLKSPAKALVRVWKKEWPKTVFVEDKRATQAAAKKILAKPDSAQLLMMGTEFQQSVWRGLTKIRLGETVTYAELAKRIGKPKAVRAVGSACGRNPLPFIVPCHRVVASNGGLGGFSGGLSIKKALLKAEGC
jgi:O-6-methylguanine DNA methyltransferase